MSNPRSEPEAASSAFNPGQRLKEAFLTGLAVTLPLIVTVVVIGFVVDFVTGTIRPLVDVVDATAGTGGLPEVALESAVVTAVLATILLVGAVAERRPDDGSIESSFDHVMTSMPGVGSIYKSFREMSDLLLDSDTESFQEVKLVEFPDRNAYAVAFVTAETPEYIEAATGSEEMQTLFLPMAPNPVMGGHVVHVPADHVYDVDMTVEEGVQSIVTSGVSLDEAHLENERQQGSPEAADREI